MGRELATTPQMDSNRWGEGIQYGLFRRHVLGTAGKWPSFCGGAGVQVMGHIQESVRESGLEPVRTAGPSGASP